MDMTHTTDGKFMVMIDCDPGCFSVWRKIESENDEELCTAIKTVFNGFGPHRSY